MNFSIASDGPQTRPSAAAGAGSVSPQPPASVRDAIEVAAESFERLAAAGRQLRFLTDESRPGRIVVEVHDLLGNALFTITGAQALEIAAGAELAQP